MEEPEGATPLEPDERVGLKFPHIQTRGELDQMEQVNIQDGLLWLGKQKKPDVLSEAFIKRLHKEMLGEVWKWAGEFRKTEKNLGVDPLQISVQLRSLLSDVGYWIENGTYKPKEIAIRFHHRLVHIHLFPNGNGRHARVLADTLLKSKLGEEPLDWARADDLQSMNERRSEYITALEKADKGDYDPLFKFINL